VTISLEEVRHIATLARLGISDERARELAVELSSILDHMQVLTRVETSSDDGDSQREHGMPLRRDAGPPIPLERTVASIAPEVRDGFFLVPRLATHGESEPAQ
jgi:aspartyl-tRNA(Asn)/glutamyl-tRNA(Gln) amidotransferase subunit C